MDKKSIEAFFKEIAPSLVELVKSGINDVSVVEAKGRVGDYSTKVDVDCENFIVSEIQKHFPNDEILAEEGHSDTAIPEGRIWLIDPICGTNNLGKGLNTFCTNIALADNGAVIASCVVDHSQGKYIWSTGDNAVLINSTPYALPAPELGQKIDVDFGAVRNVAPDVRQKHNNSLLKLVNDTDYDIVSLNSSLGFAYSAIGKMDGFINVSNHPWDIAAASFLITQVGGKITGIDGSPWTLATAGAIGGRTPEIHQELLDIFIDS